MTEHPAELVERVAKAIDVRQKQLFFDAASDHGDDPSAVYRELALAAIEAIRPSPAPDWHDKPNALGRWMCRTKGGAEFWINCEHTYDVHDSGDRWYGPVVVPEQEKKL